MGPRPPERNVFKMFHYNTAIPPLLTSNDLPYPIYIDTCEKNCLPNFLKIALQWWSVCRVKKLTGDSFQL